MENQTASELIKLYKEKKVKVLEIISNYFHNIEKHKNIFLNQFKEKALEKAEKADALYASGQAKALEGVPFIAEDVLAYKQTTAGTEFLKNYVSPFKASIIKSLEDQGAIILGKTQVSELALSLENEDFNIIKGVQNNCAPLALASDAGGYLTNCKHIGRLVSYVPSRGLISRAGLISGQISIDRLGFLTNSLDDLILFFNNLKTEGDAILNSEIKIEFKKELKGPKSKIFVPLEFKKYFTNDFNLAINTLKKEGHQVVEDSISLLKIWPLAYEVMAKVDVFSSLNRFNGFTFGNVPKEAGDSWEELIAKTRAKGFSLKLRKQILQGAYYSASDNYEKYYLQAVKVRALLLAQLKKIYTKFDLICLPVSEESKLNVFSEDNYWSFLKLCFLPSISSQINGSSIIMCGKPFDDNKLINFWANF